MKHISIEGMDGAGKTSVCRKLAEKTGFEFVEKPWHFLLDEAGIVAKDESQFETYRKLAGTVNKNSNRNFTSMFYALGSIYMYERFKDSRIVTDRHLASNYAWSGTDYNSDVYDLVISKIGKPELTVILYAPQKIIEQRMRNRNKNDPNLAIAGKSEEIYSRMIDFCESRGFDYLIIDTSDKSIEEIVNQIAKEVEE